MSQQRRISRVVNVPPVTPGFVGPGHLAAPVVSPENFEMTDPFILLMDDHLDIGDRPVGGPHPHAGFETVTLILDGAIYDRDEGGTLNAGEVQWMTAGSGVIHNEDVKTKGKVRLLQLWLTLPKKERWTEPDFQVFHSDSIPVRHESGAEIRLYSGSSGSLRSGTRNRVPVTMAEIYLEPYASAEQEVQTSYNGFAFVVDGSVRIGETVLNAGQVGWLDRPSDEGVSVVRAVAGESGARLILYAGQPQGESIVSYGPFIGDAKQDIARLFAEYQAGQFPRLSELRKERV
ncbi:MAG TPA: pirin-like C-terminal cupin domain-containing protein [Terriglobales bacterium]